MPPVYGRRPARGVPGPGSPRVASPRVACGTVCYDGGMKKASAPIGAGLLAGIAMSTLLLVGSSFNRIEDERSGPLEDLVEDLGRIGRHDEAGNFVVSSERVAEIEARITRHLGLPGGWRVRLRDEERTLNTWSGESALTSRSGAVLGRIRPEGSPDFEISFSLSRSSSSLVLGSIRFLDERLESEAERELRRTRVYYPRRGLEPILTALAAELAAVRGTGHRIGLVKPMTGDPEAPSPFLRYQVNLAANGERSHSVRITAALALPEDLRVEPPADADEDRRPPGDNVIGPVTTASSFAAGLADVDEILSSLSLPFEHSSLLVDWPAGDGFSMWVHSETAGRRVMYEGVIRRSPDGDAAELQVHARDHSMSVQTWGALIAGAQRTSAEEGEVIVALAICDRDPVAPDRPRAFLLGVPHLERRTMTPWSAKRASLRRVTVDEHGAFRVVERWSLDRISGYATAAKPEWRARTADDVEVKLLLPPRLYCWQGEELEPCRFRFGDVNGIVFGGRVLADFVRESRPR
jgi:hypothetical protein